MLEPDITELLGRYRAGDRAAEDELTRRVYPDLRRIAEAIFRGERPGHTLQPTVLVNDALVRLRGTRAIEWRDRAHFYAFAARVMRQVLVDYARYRTAEIRPTPANRLLIDDFADLLARHQQIDVELLEEALCALERLSELARRQAAGVVFRVYAGLTDDEVAAVLGCSESTAKNDWRAARAWLRSQLERLAAAD